MKKKQINLEKNYQMKVNSEDKESHTPSDNKDKNNAQEGEEITFEEAVERASTKIYFRQLSQFKSTIELVRFLLI